MKKLLLCSLILFSIVYSAVSQTPPTPRIKGQIVDAGNNNPIDFADILLYVNGEEHPSIQVMPDMNGNFVVSNLKDGSYSLLIRLIGYDVYTNANITLSSSIPMVNLGVIGMKPLEIGLGEVEVVAQKRQVIYKLDKKIIEASSSLLSSGGTAVDILENTPSIRVDAEGEVTFRGSSGFVVYVDGRPSVFSGTQALEQIPSGQIANIEIITTPSARHDTGGDVGIINIITKREFQRGLSGMVNLSGSTVSSRGVDFLVSQQNNALRWYVGGAWNDNLRESDFNQDKTTRVNDISTISRSNGLRKSNNFNHSLRLGWLYNLPKTTFNADFEGGYSGRTRNGDLDYNEERWQLGYGVNQLLESGDYFSRDEYDLHQTFYQGAVGFDHKFNDKGHNLTGSFYVRFEDDAMEYFQSDLFDKNNIRQQGHRAWEDEVRWSVRANLDYILPYSETGRVEAGYQYFSYLEDGDYTMNFWIPEKQVFEADSNIYNTFYFQRGINSIYAILADNIGRFDYQLGLRGEHDHTVLRSSIRGADRTKNSVDFFPSVHLGYMLPREHHVTASYSRRITRPQLFYMEPYITYRDYYSAEIGNPDIRSEYINSFELNYKKNIGQHTVSATTFHRTRKDKIERLRIPYEAGVTLDSMANVGNDYSTGLELSGQIQMARRWNVNINSSLYQYKVENKFNIDGENKTSSNYEIALNNGIDAGRYTRIQLDGNFVGPSVTTQGRTNAFWYVNMAVRQQMLNRKLTATLAFRNVFNSARYVSNISTADLQSITKIRPTYPLITLTLSYTFNNYNAKSTMSGANHDIFEGTNH